MGLKTEKSHSGSSSIKQKWELKSFTQRSILRGDLFAYLKRNQKHFRIQKIGQLLSPERLQKYDELYYEELSDLSIHKDFIRYFESLKNEINATNQYNIGLEIIERWETLFKLNGHNYWDVIIPLSEIFSSDDQQMILEQLADFAEPIYFRSHFLATNIIYFALKNGIYDYELLEQLYLVSLSIDLGLATDQFTYEIYLALEMDRKQPAQGKQFLVERGASSAVIDLYEMHARRSAEQFSSIFPEVNTKRIVHLIETHHWGEKSALVSFEHYDELEQLVLVLNSILPYRDFENFDFIELCQRYDDFCQSHKTLMLKEVR